MTTFSSGDIDWWFWVLLAVFPTLKFIFFWWLFRAPKRSEPVTSNLLEGKVLSLRDLPGDLDPVTLRLEIDGEVEGKAALLPLLRSTDGAHEHSAGGVRFDPEESSFLFAVDSTAAESSGDEGKSLLAKIRMSKGRKFQVSVCVSLRAADGRLISGKTKPRTFDSLEAVSAASLETVTLKPKGSVDLEISSRKIESNMDRLLSARKILGASFRQQRLLLVTAHLIAVGLFAALLSFGIRFLFSGAFVASVTAITLGGLQALSSLPVLAVWAALGSLANGGNIRRVTQLNSQARAVLSLVGAAVLSLVSLLTSTNADALQAFQVLALLLFLNSISFAVVFVKFEAGGEIAALFHPNCLRRPVSE